MDATNLLKYSQEQCEAREEAKKDERDSYNLFEALNLTTREVECHSRFLYDLLNPKGRHGMGDMFLNTFLTKVCQLQNFDLSKVRVSREYVFKDGRIDLLIEIPGQYCIVIEVKVYASDQYQQLLRYKEYTEEWKAKNGCNAESQILYLTLDGHEASEQSCDYGKVEYECISFKDDIDAWISNCIWLPNMTKNPRLTDILRQYKEILTNLNGGFNMNDEYSMNTITAISESPQSYKAAVQISECLIEARTDMLRCIFSDIENYIKELLPDTDITTKDERNDREEYYKRSPKKKPWPRLRFLLASEGTKRIALSVELDHRLYIGLVFYESESPTSEIIRIDNDNEWYVSLGTSVWQEVASAETSGGWWIDWDWLECDRNNEDDQINFRYCSNGYDELFSEEGYKAFMDNVKANIDAYLERVATFGLTQAN